MTRSRHSMKTVQVLACVFAFLGCLFAQTATNLANTPNPGLVGQLTSQLKVTPAQATGGTGAILGLAKNRLSPAEFSKVAAAVPGTDGFLKAAPAPQGTTQGASSIGSLGSMVPGGTRAPGGAGGVASLASSFQSLGLSPAMVSKFEPVIANYIQRRGGSSTASLLTQALK